MRYSVFQVGLTAIAALCASDLAVSAAWEPVRPVEFVVPAGTRGGADQMARTIQGGLFTPAIGGRLTNHPNSRLLRLRRSIERPIG